MRVLITGGTGLIGKATARRLVEKGWHVRAIDLLPSADVDGVEHVQGDILKFSDLLKPMHDCDAVIHLAAIRTPHMAPASDVFQVNAAGTFNVFEAAAKTGIRRVVQASSINALGSYYGTVDLNVRYLPIDEDHPTFTTDVYSFSKQVDEEIGEYFWRRDGISSTALRFPGVYPAGFSQREDVLERRKRARQLMDEVAVLPEAEWVAKLADVKRRDAEFRATRPFDFKPEDEPIPNPPLQDDPLFRAYVGERYNFWVAVDERDAALSIELSVTADYEGAHPLFINDKVNYLGYDTRTLARLFFPEVTQFKHPLSGMTALISNERARALIGYTPEHSLAYAAGEHQL